jgi:hypothetical protein
MMCVCVHISEGALAGRKVPIERVRQTRALSSAAMQSAGYAPPPTRAAGSAAPTYLETMTWTIFEAAGVPLRVHGAPRWFLGACACGTPVACAAAVRSAPGAARRQRCARGAGGATCEGAGPGAVHALGATAVSVRALTPRSHAARRATQRCSRSSWPSRPSSVRAGPRCACAARHAPARTPFFRSVFPPACFAHASPTLCAQACSIMGSASRS